MTMNVDLRGNPLARIALRPLFVLSAVVTIGVLWSASAQALHVDFAGSEARIHARNNIGSSIVLNDTIFARIFRSRITVIDPDPIAAPIAGRLLLRRAGNIRLSRGGIDTTAFVVPEHRLFRGRPLPNIFDQIHVRPRPANPIPEPSAALVFVFGIGIAAARLRR